MNTKHNCNICGGKYTTAHRTKHIGTLQHIRALENSNACEDDIRYAMDKKERYVKHSEQVKQWRLDNNDKIKEYMRTKIECNICHANYSLAHKSRHKETVVHIKALYKLFDKLDEQFNEIILLHAHSKELYPKIHLDCTLI